MEGRQLDCVLVTITTHIKTRLVAGPSHHHSHSTPVLRAHQTVARTSFQGISCCGSERFGLSNICRSPVKFLQNYMRWAAWRAHGVRVGPRHLRMRHNQMNSSLPHSAATIRQAKFVKGWTSSDQLHDDAAGMAIGMAQRHIPSTIRSSVHITTRCIPLFLLCQTIRAIRCGRP